VFITDHLLRFRIQVVVTPEHALEVGLLDTELLRVELGKLAYAEAPAVDGRGEDDVPLLRREVDVLIITFLELFVFVDLGLGLVSGSILLGGQALFALLVVAEVVFHPLASEKATHDRVDVFDEVGKMVVRFHRGELEFGDESVHFVDDEDGFQSVLPCLAEDGDGLREDERAELKPESGTYLGADTFHNIDQNQSSIA